MSSLTNFIMVVSEERIQFNCLETRHDLVDSLSPHCHAKWKREELTYPEFPFESEAKGDSLIGVHQTKTVKN